MLNILLCKSLGYQDKTDLSKIPVGQKVWETER